MTFPPHYLHVYQRPKVGSAFVARYSCFNYQHTITNRGWYDTASCDISVRSDAEGQKILSQYLGCFVAIYVDNPAVPIWEGLINRITLNSGGSSYTISLDEMANRVSVVYTGAANAAAQTTVVDNTTSQAIYGIKQEQIEIGADNSAASLRTVLGNTILAQRAFPQASVSQAQGDTNIVHLEMIGIYHTIEWAKFFTVLATATVDFGSNVGAVVGIDPNGTTFYNNADTTKISANAETVVTQVRGVSYWERILKIAEAGDGSNYWVIGMNPTDPTLRTRSLFYRVANTAIEYTARKSDNLRPRTLYGRIVPPWWVRPDRGIRVTDALVGLNGSILTDPSSVYIQSVQYDANSQMAQWFGADDTTARAAFLLNRGFKPLTESFGAPLRIIVT